MMMAACGGGRLDGTYVLTDSNAENALLIISGNKMKVMQDGEVLDEISFNYLEQNKEKGISKGVINMTTANGNNYEEGYEFDGNKLSLWGMVYTKQNTTPQKTSKTDTVFEGANSTILDGVYVGKYDGMSLAYIFSDNKMKVEVNGKLMQENKIKIAVEHQSENFIKGVITLIDEHGNLDMEFKLEYGMALYFDGSNNIAFMKKDIKK